MCVAARLRVVYTNADALDDCRFPLQLMVNACYMVALAIYLGVHSLFLGGPVVAFQSNGLPEKLVNFFSSKVRALTAPLSCHLLIFFPLLIRLICVSNRTVRVLRARV